MSADNQTNISCIRKLSIILLILIQEIISAQELQCNLNNDQIYSNSRLKGGKDAGIILQVKRSICSLII